MLGDRKAIRFLNLIVSILKSRSAGEPTSSFGNAGFLPAKYLQNLGKFLLRL
jgi:hypothetical protein